MFSRDANGTVTVRGMEIDPADPRQLYREKIARAYKEVERRVRGASGGPA